MNRGTKVGYGRARNVMARANNNNNEIREKQRQELENITARINKGNIYIYTLIIIPYVQKSILSNIDWNMNIILQYTCN